MTPEHIRPLTALRFYAAFMVFTVHATMLPGLEWLHSGFQGKIGVSVFFVLSGFVMSHVYFETDAHPGTRDNALRFYIARVTKIYPLHVLTFLLALPLGLASATARVDPLSLPFHLTLTNLFSPFNDFGAPPNKVAWTLSCEMFFYLLTPPLFAILHYCRRWRVLLLSVLVGLVGVATILAWPACDVYLLGPFRWVDYLAGVGLFLIVRQRSWFSARVGGWLLGTGVVFFALLCAWHTPLERKAPTALLMLPGSVLVVGGIAALRRSRSWWLTSDLMVLLGDASFALYIVHELIFRYLRFAMISVGITLPGILGIPTLLLLAVAFQFLAVFLHRRYEMPIQKWGRQRLARWLRLPSRRQRSDAGLVPGTSSGGASPAAPA